MEKVETMVREVKALGLETCATLGMLKEEQAQRLAEPVWITTTTIWIPRRSFTTKSFPPANIRTVWIRSVMCAPLA
jgi:hypothetical protein